MHHYQYHVFNFNFTYFTCYIDATLQSKLPSHRIIKYYLILYLQSIHSNFARHRHKDAETHAANRNPPSHAGTAGF